jgi:hypothetical protein
MKTRHFTQNLFKVNLTIVEVKQLLQPSKSLCGYITNYSSSLHVVVTTIIELSLAHLWSCRILTPTIVRFTSNGV